MHESYAPQITLDRGFAMTSVAANESPGDGRAAAAPALLGNNADLTYPPLYVLPPPTTVKAWYLRSYARDVLKRAGIERRMRWCGSKISRNAMGVSVYQRPTRAYGRVGGVCVCGQSLCCPVCAPRIAAFRAAEVAEAFKLATARGFTARLCTFTIPHHAGTPLGEEIETFQAAWKIFQNGSKNVRREEGALGSHLAREVTWGAVNGWNYHHHWLRYDLPGTANEKLMQAQWLASLDAVGRMREGAKLYAFNCGSVGTEAGARYVAKLATSVEAQARAIGSEIASSATKGKNLASLLLAASNGDAVAEKTWSDGVAYITAKKISSVRWSRGLRDKLGLSVEKSDTQVADEAILPTDIYLCNVTPHQWRVILRWKAEFSLCIAANQGVDAVNSFLLGLDLGGIIEAQPSPVITSIQADKELFRRPVGQMTTKEIIC